ncbi:DUF3667 domain-containing protein [Pontibacter pudoricolor]|uniref:DUF3667 domain-containing protein n=1 Tax=Pontibacter pudoricolor TaxID=2694930 RepID=UPI001391666C|nr:DUF3667 domain-containing protein [Pontibacter pudoricolor]
MKKHYRSEKNCLNCDTIVPDKYCPSCGQENLELRENFLHLVLHSVGHYFHFESKFATSIIPLLTRPGYLTKEYFAGKRASHLNPVSMYIFISILFFFLFTANSNSNKKDIIKENAAEENAISKEDAETLKNIVGNTVSEKAGDYTYSLLDNAQAITDSTGNSSKVNTNAAPTTAEGKKSSLTLGGDNAITNSVQTKLRKVMDDDLSSELFKNKLVSHLPKMMFILLPLFALILKLVNYRSKKFYVEHLIYSIHVHSFLFLFGSFLIILDWMLPFMDDWIQLFGVAAILWYIYRSMRNIYSSSRWRTVYKFSLLAFAYSLLMLLSGAIVVVATLYTM